MPAASGVGNLGHLMATIGADITQLRADMAQATKLMQDASDKMTNSTKKVADGWKKVGKEMKSAGKYMSLAITTPLIAAATYAFKQASDSAEWLNRVNIAFKSSSQAVEDFSTTTLKSIGLASITTMEYTGMIGDMATSMGLGTAAAADLAIGMVDLAGDMSSLKNMEIGRVMEALTGIFTGQIRPLRALGVIMTVAAIKTYMLSQGITKQYKDLTQAELIMIRYNYILSVTKNSQGDFARTFNLAANQMRLFGQNLKEVALAFGNVLMPLILPVIVKLNEFFTWVTQLNTVSKQWIVGIGGIAAALGPLLLVLGYLIVNVFPGILIAFAKIGQAFTWLFVTNPWVGLATAILAVAAAVYLFVTRLTAAEKIQKNLQEASDKATKSLKEEQAAQSVSIQLAMEHKQGSEGRARALNKINTIYPELLANLKIETATNEELNDILTKVNSSYKEKIELAAMEAKRTSIFDQQVAVQMELYDLIDKQVVLQNKLNKAKQWVKENPQDFWNMSAKDFLAFENPIGDVGYMQMQLDQLRKPIYRLKESLRLLGIEWDKTFDPGLYDDALMNSYKIMQTWQKTWDEEQAKERKRIADLGIIGRLEEDLKNEKEQWTAAQSEADIIYHKIRMNHMEIELKKYQEMMEKMTKLKPIIAPPNSEWVRNNPQTDEKSKARILYRNKDALDSIMQPLAYAPNTEMLKFWDSYENEFVRINDLQDIFGNDLSIYDSLSSKMDLAWNSMQNAIPIYGAQSEEVRWLTEDYLRLVNQLQAVNDKMEMGKSIASAFSDSFASMADRMVSSMDLATTGMEGFFAIMLKGFWKLLGMFLGQALGAAISGAALASTFTGPAAIYTLPMYIAEGVGAVMAAFAAIPTFKDGGIISGPTMGMMAEYPGARSNPEVIAPLDQLQKLMNGNGGSEDITVHGRLIGEDLYISNQRYNKRKTLVQ